MREEDYWKDLLDGKRGNLVTGHVPEPEETSPSDDVFLEDGFNKFIVQYQAGAMENIGLEGKRDDLGIKNPGLRDLEDELADELKFHNTLLTPDSDFDPHEELEQQEINLPESYGGFTGPQLSGYDSQQEGLEGPNVGYQGPSANGNGKYLR